MDGFFRKVGSAFSCGTLMLALVPVNTGLSTNRGALAGTTLNNESNESSESFIKGNKGRSIDNKIPKSRNLDSNEIKNFKKPKNDNKVNIKEKKAKKTPAGNKNVNKDGRIVTNKDEAPLGDVVKVGAGVGVSTVLFRLSEAAVNKIKNKSSMSSDSSGVKSGEDIERVLEYIKNERDQLKNERDKAIKEKTDAEKKANDAYNALPGGTRAWLFGFWSYLWSCLGIFGEGKKETKVLAEHDAGLRILLSISGLVFFLISLVVTIVALISDHGKHTKTGLFCILITLFLPPVGVVPTCCFFTVYCNY